MWCCGWLGACKYTKHLTHNQTLLKENKLSLRSDVPLRNKGELESALLSLANPQPNSHLLDLGFLPKYKLWRYNNNYRIYQRDTNHVKLQKRKVERPALLDTAAIERSRRNMRQYLINQGFFYNSVEANLRIDSAEQTGVVEYVAHTGKAYHISRIDYECDDPNILWLIRQNEKGSALQRGQRFTNFQCGLERDRLYRIIRNAGFFDFKTDNISFRIDTVDRSRLKRLLDDPFEQAGNYTATAAASDSIQVMLRILQSRDSTFNQIYRIADITVELSEYGGGRGEEQNLPIIESTLDQIRFRYRSLPINRKVISRNILLQPGDVYNSRDIEQTVTRLNQLGVFQFVNFRFIRDSAEAGKLHLFFSLSMAPKRDIVGTTDLSTSDGDYRLGLGAGITYKNKNLAHGANQLMLRGTYATEFRNDALLTGTKQFYQSGNNLNLSANMSFPKFIVPFNNSILNKRNVPFTIFGVNYSFIQRIQNYAFVNISGSFGYTWKETAHKSWRLNPAFLTVTRLPEKYIGAAFQNRLNNDRYLQQIFSDNLIYGENFTFEYNSPFRNRYQSFSTLKIGFEEAGAILSGVNLLWQKMGGANLDPIAQYLRLDADARNYKNGRKLQWVNRVMIGVGMPVGDERTLPFIKQYSAGGAFSNRGFRARALGPGRAPDSVYQAGVTFIDRTGDIKFEANSELRFDLLKLFAGAINLKGAAFADAGNIWLTHRSASVPGGEINSKYLWQDIAMSAGAGLRLDFTFFVFRLDLAYPVKQPSRLTRSGWAFDQLTYKSGIWNIAVGYPF